MTRRSFRFVLPAVLALPVLGAYPGGWAAITVEDLPDYVVARQPVDLSFTVRQHGVTPLSGLSASVAATDGSLEASAAAIPGQGAGRYIATLTLPRSGEWTITIQSGFRGSNTTLLPLPAIDAGTRAPPLAEAERGRRLFVAKGCVTCHVHSGVQGRSLSIGPELTGRRYPAAFLGQFLANPAMISAPRGGTWDMPNLNLKQGEIAALVAFINGEAR